MRAIPKDRLKIRIRSLSAEELAEMELATDEAVGRVEPDTDLESRRRTTRHANGADAALNLTPQAHSPRSAFYGSPEPHEHR